MVGGQGDDGEQGQGPEGRAVSAKKYGRKDFQRDMREQESQDAKLRQLTFGLFRQLGRVRVTAENIAALDPRDKVSFATDNTTGDVIVTYESAPSEEPGAPPKLSAGVRH